MILKNKKQRLKKKRNNFIKTTLKLLKKKNSTTIMCANIYLQYCDLLVAYNDLIIYIFCWVIVVLSDKKNTTQDGRAVRIYTICLKKNSFLLLSDVINFVVFNHRSMYVFDKNFLKPEKEVKWWKSHTLQEPPKNLELFSKNSAYLLKSVQKKVHFCQFYDSDRVATMLQNCHNSIATVCDIFQKVYDNTAIGT